MNKLMCPCGREIKMVRKLGISYYSHVDTNDLCKSLYIYNDSSEPLERTMNTNFQNFVEYTKLSLLVNAIVTKSGTHVNSYSYNPTSQFCNEISKFTGDYTCLRSYMEKFKEVFIKEPETIGYIGKIFGRQGMFLLQEIGIPTNGKTSHVYTLDLGINKLIDNRMFDSSQKGNLDRLLNSLKDIKNNKGSDADDW